MNSNSLQKPWHFAQWPPLAWLETVIKLVAIGIGLAAFIVALDEGSFKLEAGFTLAEFILLGILSFGLIAAIFDRIKDREIIAMEFVIVNNLGHWGMLLAVAGDPGPGWYLIAFCSLFLCGDLVKMLFIKVHKFRVRDTPQPVLYGLTGGYAAGYAAILILELVR